MLYDAHGMANKTKPTTGAGPKAAAHNSNRLDDWGRLPKPGDRIAGLTRSTINQLVLGPDAPVESKLFRVTPDAKRGIRLIKMRGDRSLEAYIVGLPGGAN
jgi:hypothetical protein